MKLFNEPVTLSPEAAEQIVRELDELRVYINNQMTVVTGSYEILEYLRAKAGPVEEAPESVDRRKRVAEVISQMPHSMRAHVESVIAQVHGILGFRAPEGCRNIWSAARDVTRQAASSAEAAGGSAP